MGPAARSGGAPIKVAEWTSPVNERLCSWVRYVMRWHPEAKTSCEREDKHRSKDR